MSDVKISQLPVTSTTTGGIVPISITGTTYQAAASLFGSPLPATIQSRLTTQSGVPVSTSDRTSQGTLYFTNFGGNHTSLYFSSVWTDYVLPELSLSLTVTSGKNYDVFVYPVNATTAAMELSAAWADDHTPTDAIVLQDGVSVKSSDHSRRWVGTIRASGTNITEDSLLNRYVWNANNQVPRRLLRLSGTDIFSYNSTVWIVWNSGLTPNSVNFVTGALQSFTASGWVDMITNAGADYAFATIGLNQISAEDLASTVSGQTLFMRGAMIAPYLSGLGLNTLTVLVQAINIVQFNAFSLQGMILA